MIVPMKKISLVVMERDRESTLEKLREVGVVHLKKTNVSSEYLAELLEQRARIGQALGALSRYPVKEGAAPEISFMPPDIAAYILGLFEEKASLQEELAYLLGEKRRVTPWGDFDPKDIGFLNERGVRLYLYSFPRQAHKRIGDAIQIIILYMDKNWVKAVSVGAEIPGMKSFMLPDYSLSEIDDYIEANRFRIREIEAELISWAHHKKTIEAEIGRVLEKIEFETARAGMETLEDETARVAIAWLTGFVPNEQFDRLKQAAQDNEWTLAWDDPSLDDRPPTILRNKPAIKIIQPLFSMLGTLPGYWEYDISLSYMVFLCFFFAMIFGDAGYGLLLLGMGAALGVIAKKKSGVFPDAAKLVMLLSFCTMVWGSMTGSWFAIPVQNLPAALRVLILPPFNNAGPLAEFPPLLQKIFKLPAAVPVDDLKTKWNIQFLCFTTGMIQLICARVINIKRAMPTLAAIAQAGWFVAIVGVYFVVLSVLLRMALPPFAQWFIVAGIGLNLIFSEQKGGNFLVNVVKSLSNFFAIFVKAVGSFADIISYIRLFAVGLAGGMIAQTFNAMAIPAEGLGSFGLGFIMRLIMAVFVLAAGHALNMLMNTLSLIIHGVRLNLLEYAGNHLGMDWSGYAYMPFSTGRKNKV